MNKDFKIVGNNVIVFTDDKGRVTREITNNIEDILICENNIEEMEEKLENEKNKIVFSKKKLKSGWLYTGCGALWLVSFILNSIRGNWLASFFNALCVVSYTCMGYFGNIRKELKFIKSNKKVILELEQNLEAEKEKLNKLNNDKANDLMYVETDKKPIDKSEQIINLKRKLDVIYSFEIHKTKIIRYYKKGILREMMRNYLCFYDEDFCLLEELIKNELNKNEEKKIGNEKVLKRR